MPDPGVKPGGFALALEISKKENKYNADLIFIWLYVGMAYHY